MLEIYPEFSPIFTKCSHCWIFYHCRPCWQVRVLSNSKQRCCAKFNQPFTSSILSVFLPLVKVIWSFVELLLNADILSFIHLFVLSIIESSSSKDFIHQCIRRESTSFMSWPIQRLKGAACQGFKVNFSKDTTDNTLSKLSSAVKRLNRLLQWFVLFHNHRHNHLTFHTPSARMNEGSVYQ